MVFSILTLHLVTLCPLYFKTCLIHCFHSLAFKIYYFWPAARQQQRHGFAGYTRSEIMSWWPRRWSVIRPARPLYFTYCFPPSSYRLSHRFAPFGWDCFLPFSIIYYIYSVCHCTSSRGVLLFLSCDVFVLSACCTV